MATYRKKPVEVEAFKFYCDNMPGWFMDKVTDNTVMLYRCNYTDSSNAEVYCEIDTLEGKMRANSGDYIIRGVQGEIYPCKPDIFEKTYEVVENG